MVNEIQYTTMRRVLDNLLDHPLLQDLSLEQAVRHVIRFISLHGYSKMYHDKIEVVDIEDFRGLLPCDLISITQVRDLTTNICLRSMTDSFTPGMRPKPEEVGISMKYDHKDLNNNVKPAHPKHLHHPMQPMPPVGNLYIPPSRMVVEELTFKTQGRCIFTSFPHGKVEVAYRAIPVDEDGFPLIIDNETYLAALEAYIKKQVFTVKFDTGKIAPAILQNAQRDYAVLAAELRSEFTTPSPSEMESYTRMYTSLIPRMREFDKAFKNVGDREYLRKH